MKFNYYYYFKLLNLFRQQWAYSKDNFCKPRGPQHTYYYGKQMQEREKKYTFN